MTCGPEEQIGSHGNVPPLWTPLFLHRRALERHVAAAVRELLSERARATGTRVSVIDVGCGAMPYRRWFAAHEMCAVYEGADLVPAPGVRRIDPDAQTVDAPDEAYDLVVHFQVMEHVRDTQRFLLECRRLLKPGGRMFFTAPFLFEYHGVPSDYYRWSKDGLAAALEAARFRVLDIRPVESDWESALTAIQLVLARVFGYRITKPLFAALNLAGALPLRTASPQCPISFSALAEPC